MKAFVLIAAISALFLGLVIVSDESDATSFGSSTVGAETVVFDANAGSGGYTQYVLNGNSVYFPTEYKAGGTSNLSYQQISRGGYVLTGWRDTESGTVYVPGSLSPVITNDRSYQAVWTGMQAGNNTSSEHFVIPAGEYFSPDVHSGSNAGIVTTSENAFSSAYVTVVKTVSIAYNGNEPASARNSVSNGGISVGLQDGVFSISGTPDMTGWYEIHLHYYSHSTYGGDTTTEADACWYLSVYDSHDPSNICHTTYDNSDIGYGPYHTAVKLPDSVSQRQKGWNIEVDGSPAIFPVGGSYTLVRKETVLTANEYTFDEIAESGVAGVIAYNANGGFYNGSFAELVPVDGYSGLKNGNLVTKEGYTFIGWNPSGSSDDPVYPAGYLYDIASGYIELKAVWVPGTVDFATVYLENPDNGAQNTSFRGAVGYDYVLPVHGFDISRFWLVGWSDTSYKPGEGEPSAGESVTVTSTGTYYAVFEPAIYHCTVVYDGNGGTGSMSSVSYDTYDVPYYITVSGSQFSYEGYRFAGWAETRFAESPSYLPGDSVCFTGTKTVTLFAVWEEKPSPNSHLFSLIFHGNGASVTNVPPAVYRVTGASEVVAYVPNTVPRSDGYDFAGWSTTQYGEAVHYPGDRIVMTLPEGETSVSVVLYAVWEPKNDSSGDGTPVTVTFVGMNGVLRTITVMSGNPAIQITAPSVPGYAFLGWFTTSTGKWDFASPVDDDMTLKATYLKIFHITTEGNVITVVPDCNSPYYRVAFSDGYSAEYDSRSIPGHAVTENTTGSVTVTVRTEQGERSAVCFYDAGEGQHTEQTGIPLTYAVGGILALLFLLVIARRFI